MSESVNIDLVGQYNSALAEIKAIDDKLTGLKGTIAQVQKDAAQAVLDAPVALAITTYYPTTKDYNSVIAQLAATKDRTMTEYVVGWRGFMADLDAFLEHSAKDWILAHHAGLDDGAGLRARRAELVTTATAFFVVIGQMVTAGVISGDVAIDPIPDAPKGSTAGRSASGGAKVSGVTYYRVTDGARKEWGPEYDLSRVAFRLGRCGADVLRAALKAAGWDGNLTTDGEYTVTVKTDKGDDMTATIGWTVSQPAAVESSTDTADGEAPTE